MKNNLLVVKERLDYIKLVQLLSKTTEETVRKVEKDVGWLQYAKKSAFGYDMLHYNSERFEVLEQIAKRVCEDSQKSIQEVSDTLSYLVNTQVIDEVRARGLKLNKSVLTKHKKYLTSLLISTIVINNHIPRHFWLKLKKQISKDTFEVIDLVNGSELVFLRSMDKNFVFYEQKRNIIR